MAYMYIHVYNINDLALMPNIANIKFLYTFTIATYMYTWS